MKAEELVIGEHYDEFRLNNYDGKLKEHRHVRYVGAQKTRSGVWRHLFQNAQGITVWLNPENMYPAAKTEEAKKGTK